MTRSSVGTLVVLLITAFAFGTAARAADPRPAARPAAKKKDPHQGPRKKEINFEERVIEGLNNRGYESLSQTGTVDDPSKEKLYRKRAEFDEESKYLLREMEYLK